MPTVYEDDIRMFDDCLNGRERSIEGLYMTSDSHRREDDHMHVQLRKGQADISISFSAITEEKAILAQFLHGTLGWWYVSDQHST